MAKQCNADDLRLILSRLTPAMVRLVRAVAKSWLAAADHTCLWQAHLRGQQPSYSELHVQMTKMAQVAGCSRSSSQLVLDVAHSKFKDLSFLSQIPQLVELNISACKDLVDVSALTCCLELRKLVMWQPALYCNASGAEAAAQQLLRERYDRYPVMQVVSQSLSMLSSLESLYLGVDPAEVGVCDWVTDITFVTKMPNLKLISLRGCRRLRDVSPLSACSTLVVVDLRDVGYSLEQGSLNCLVRCGSSLVRVILGVDEFDSDPAEYICAGIMPKIVLAPATGCGDLEEAMSMVGDFAGLRDSANWGSETAYLCY